MADTNGDVWTEHGHEGRPCEPAEAVYGDVDCELRVSPLAMVLRADRALFEARNMLDAAVEFARAEGETWAAIGATLGVSRQAAQERFGRRQPASQPD